MFRFCLSTLSSVSKVSSTYARVQAFCPSLVNARSNSIFSCISSQLISRNLYPISNLNDQHARGVKRVIDDAAEAHRLLRFDKVHGKRTSVDIVPKQFYRLNWGMWIRTKCGRDKKLHKKSSRRLRKLRKHVFCNAQQCRLLDKLTGPYFKRRHYYVDDDYEPYHSREEFLHTRKKPLPPTGNYNVDAV